MQRGRESSGFFFPRASSYLLSYRSSGSLGHPPHNLLFTTTSTSVCSEQVAPLALTFIGFAVARAAAADEATEDGDRKRGKEIGLDYPIAGNHFSGSGVSGASAELGIDGGVLNILMP